MPRFKVLKGVAHNIGHSFTSLMNYSINDYSMGHILRFARETGLNTLTIDFVAGEGQPASLLRDPISRIAALVHEDVLGFGHALWIRSGAGAISYAHPEL